MDTVFDTKEQLLESWEKKIKNKVSKDWINRLCSIFVRKEINEIFIHLKELKKFKTIYPKQEDLLNAFKYCSWDEMKVVILGQDPYHTHDVADGLAFSTRSIVTPPSLMNIYKELCVEYEKEYDKIDGKNDLRKWAYQGVLLLNTALTVERSSPNSHSELWKPFTIRLIKYISEHKEPIVFILWGRHAQEYAQYIDRSKHYILESAHPSPLSAHKGFFGSQPFTKTNLILEKLNKKPIKWLNV